MRQFIFFGLFLFYGASCVSFCSSTEGVVSPESYNLKVRIEPASGEIFVSGCVSLNVENADPENISFDLHETFDITSIRIDNEEARFITQENEPFLLNPASKKVQIELPKVDVSDIVEMEIKYHGTLKDIPEFGADSNQTLALDDQINSRMVELAVYSCWYPQFGYGHKFDVDLEVSLPREWTCVCSGNRTESTVDDDRIISRWTARKDMDIVIIASPEFKQRTIESSAGRIEIYCSELPDAFIIKEAEDIESAMKLFTELLGRPYFSGEVIKHVYSPKKKGQGNFARAGMIVTSEGRTLDELEENPEVSYLHSISHEMGHFWWNFGYEQGDWINETFAEYFSLVAVQNISSQEEYNDCIVSYTDFVGSLPEDAPSLSTVPPVNDETGYVVRYYKGSLMLRHIREILGDEGFFSACRDFYRMCHDRKIGTDEFRIFWTDKLGKRHAVLNAWIESMGGMPEINSER